MHVLGIDIGGTGIKGAPIDTTTGRLLQERIRFDTPDPASPKNVARVVQQIVAHFKWRGPIGCTLPAVVKEGVVLTAANIDSKWLGCNAEALLRKATKRQVVVINDADAAGVAELHFGAGLHRKGLVVMVTLGTGIGTALLFNRELIPNSEFGHLELNGKDAERSASNRVREHKELSWHKWGKQVNNYLCALEALLWPDLFIIGGGVSKKFPKFSTYLNCKAKVLPAKLLNDAGIVGAAVCAAPRALSKGPKR
ncbi:MAG: ROK family protein, partial [Proteobacteria bacterium]|nr:ROK family protein [Pseudomonadota bacterium]